MRISPSAIALAILGFTSALPTATTSTPAANSNNLCPSIPKDDSKVDPPSNPTKPNTSNIIHPRTISQYDVWTGAVRYQETHGKIFVNGKTTDTTTLLTFTFPPESKGKMCSFHFDLSSDATSKVSGTGKFDVFISLAPATRDAKTWPSGNLRDQHIGRMVAKPHGQAEWVSGLPVFGQSFPCPAGEMYGGELVGVDAPDNIEWRASSGPYISY
ncbi:hypothetical protein Q7P37_004789 [Cladosporium fusiforme]